VSRKKKPEEFPLFAQPHLLPDMIGDDVLGMLDELLEADRQLAEQQKHSEPAP
jgi:hypothetical protein